MSDRAITFLTSLFIALTWNILLLSSFLQKIISCFEYKVYSFLSTLAIKQSTVCLKKCFEKTLFRSSRPEVFCKKVVLRNFAKFTGKHLCQSLFFIKVEGLGPATLLKKRLWYRCFFVNFAKFLRTTFLIEHLRWLLLFIDGAIPLRNFEFRKKNVPLLTKDFFSQSFQSFSRKGELCKKCNLKAIRSN